MKVQGSNTGIPPRKNKPEQADSDRGVDKKKFSGIPVSETPEVDNQLSKTGRLHNQKETILPRGQHERQVSNSSTDSGYVSEPGANDYIASAENKSQTNAGTSVSERIKSFEEMSRTKVTPAPKKNPVPRKSNQVSVTALVNKFENHNSSAGEKKSTPKDNYKATVSVSELVDKFQETAVDFEVDDEELSTDPFHELVVREVSKFSIHAALDAVVSPEYEDLKNDCTEENLQKVYKRFEQAVEERLASDPENQIQFGRKIPLAATVFDAMWMILSGKGINFTEDQAFDIFIESNGVDVVNRIEGVCQTKPGFERRFTVR